MRVLPPLSGLLLVGLAACSGGGGNPAGAEAGGGLPPGDGGVVAAADAAPELVLPTYTGRIVVTPSALLFTKAGEQAALRAQAYDATGAKIDVTFTWESSRPGELTVDAQGQVVSVTALGSTQIRARAGMLTSAPVLALVAEPAPGALLVSDAQVVAGPTLVDPTADYGPGAQVKLTVAGIDAPAAGTMVLAREGKPVAGRVVSAMASAAGPGMQDLVLQLAPLLDMFTRLHAEGTQAVDGASLAEALAMPPAPTMALRRPRPRRGAGPQFQLAETEFNLGPLKCKGSVSAGALTGDVSFKVVPNMSFDYRLIKDAGGDWSDVLVKLEGGVSASGNATVKFAASFTGSAACKLEIVKIPLPIGGPIGVALGLKAPIGLKGDLTGTLMSVPFEYGFKIAGSSQVKLGFAYTPQAGSQDLGDFHVGFDGEPSFKLQSAPSSSLPATLTVGASFGIYTGLDVGLPFGLLSASLLEASLQLKTETKMATIETQLEEPSYAAKYEMKSVITAGAGSSVKAALSWLGGLVTLNPSVTVESPPLARSPLGTFLVDTAQVSRGEAAHFIVALDSTKFLSIDNVIEVRIYQTAPGKEVALLETIPAAAGTTYPWTWTPKADDNDGDYIFYAAVVSKLGPLLPLEVTEDSHKVVHLGQQTWHGTVDYTVTGMSDVTKTAVEGAMSNYTTTTTTETTAMITGHGGFQVTESSPGELTASGVSGDWTEIRSTTIHILRVEAVQNGCTYDTTETGNWALNGSASPDSNNPILMVNGSTYELQILTPGGMTSGPYTHSITGTITGGCRPFVDSTSTTTSSGSFQSQSLTVAGMLDPQMPTVIKDKKDVLVDGDPPLTYTVSVNLTRK